VGSTLEGRLGNKNKEYMDKHQPNDLFFSFDLL
jgi:hypothetical protein